MKRLIPVLIFFLFCSCSIVSRHKKRHTGWPYRYYTEDTVIFTKPYFKDSIYTIDTTSFVDIYVLKSDVLKALEQRRYGKDSIYYHCINNLDHNIYYFSGKNEFMEKNIEEIDIILGVSFAFEDFMHDGVVALYNKRDSCWVESYIEKTIYGILGYIWREYYIDNKDSASFLDVSVAFGE